MDTKTTARMAEFKQHPVDRERLAKELLPDLKKVESDKDMGMLIGKPDEISWHYTLFYSSSMRIAFNAVSEVLGVSSDVMEKTQAGDASGRKMDAMEVAAASSEFQSQPYSRQEAARKLLPSIKTGMKSEEVKGLLGRPDSRSWHYFLSSKGGSKLVIVFDPAGKVIEVRVIDR